MRNYYCTVIMIVDTEVEKGELASYTGLLLSRSEVGVGTRLGGVEEL